MIDNKGRPHMKAGPIKYTKGFRSKNMMRKAVNYVIIFAIFLVVIGSILVFIKQPVKTKDGYVVAESQIHEFVEHGEKVLIVDDESYHLFTPLKRFLFTQDVYFAKVVAGPYGEIEQTKGSHRVTDGTNVISVVLENSDKNYLDMEYIARKLDSNGEEVSNEYDLIITNERILGKASSVN